MLYPDIYIQLPKWVEDFCRPYEHKTFENSIDRMKFVLELADRNIEEKTGGPFGAAVFDLNSKKLVAPGVNQVITQKNPIAHAEIIALSIASKINQNYDLSKVGAGQFELVSSTDPCVMCLGAIIWSGVVSLVCAARDEDASSIGFDSGPKINQWIKDLESRSIKVSVDVCREESAALMQKYWKTGAEIYNVKR